VNQLFAHAKSIATLSAVGQSAIIPLVKPYVSSEGSIHAKVRA
jgi:hypothetical protein